MSWGDLVGIPYAGCNCYQLLRRAQAVLGVQLPENEVDLLLAVEDFGRELTSEDELQLGDVLICDGEGDYGVHLAFVLAGAKTILHATPGGKSRIDRRDVWERLSTNVRYARPLSLC